MKVCRLEIENFRGVKEAALLLPDHVVLIGDNKRLSTKLALATEKSTAIDSRLERIEALLGMLIAKAGA